MSSGNKARNMMQQWQGKFKEVSGRALNDRRLEAEGRTDQRISHLKGAGEKIKDAFRPRRRRRMTRPQPGYRQY